MSAPSISFPSSFRTSIFACGPEFPSTTSSSPSRSISSSAIASVLDPSANSSGCREILVKEYDPSSEVSMVPIFSSPWNTSTVTPAMPSSPSSRSPFWFESAKIIPASSSIVGERPAESSSLVIPSSGDAADAFWISNIAVEGTSTFVVIRIDAMQEKMPRLILKRSIVNHQCSRPGFEISPRHHSGTATRSCLVPGRCPSRSAKARFLSLHSQGRS